MPDPWRHFDRRAFLRRGALLIPALHANLLAAADPPREPAPEPDPKELGRVHRPVDFREIELRSHRIDEQQVFYRDMLGLDTTLDGAGLVVQAGTTRLRFLPAEGDSEPMYHFAFMIPENKLDRAMEWMRGRAPLQPNGRRGPVFHFRRWNAHSFYFFDPAGHLAEFIAHHELPTAASGAFSSRDILFACEIGLVAPRLDGLLSELSSRLDLKPFLSGGDSFVPVGDRHGLFICVKEDRIWLGSDLPAMSYPVVATLGGRKQDSVEITGLPFTIRTTR